MPETNGVTAPPGAKAPASADKTTGPANLTGQMLAQRFMKSEVQRQQETPATEQKAEEVAQAPDEPTVNAAVEGETQVEPVQTEAAGEPEAKAAEETEAEAENVLSPEPDTLDPKLQKKIDRRIGKEVAKRKELERRLNELQGQLLERQSQPAGAKEETPIVALPGGVMPLANINEVQGLVQLQQQAKEAVRWAEAQLDAETPEVQIEGHTYTRADLKGIIRNAKVTLEDHIPARYQFLTAKQQSQQAAYERYPFLKDRTSEEYVQAQTAYQQYPWLRNLPNADEIIGRQIMGAKYEVILAEEAKKKTAKTAAKAPPPKPTSDHASVSSADTSVGRVPAQTRSKQQLTALSEQVKAKGAVSGREYAELLAMRSQLRNSR